MNIKHVKTSEDILLDGRNRAIVTAEDPTGGGAHQHAEYTYQSYLELQCVGGNLEEVMGLFMKYVAGNTKIHWQYQSYT